MHARYYFKSKILPMGGNQPTHCGIDGTVCVIMYCDINHKNINCL